MRSPHSLASAGLAALLAASALAQDAPPSPRNANYQVAARLDAAARTLTGRTVLTWRNLREEPTSELWFHLYWNAWRNDRSSWMRQDVLSGRRDIDNPTEDDWGYIEVDGVRLVADSSAGETSADGGADVPADLAMDHVRIAGAEELGTRFESPDDGNPHDRTVMVVDLPRPVAQGETVQVELDWRARVPRTFARTGYRGNYFFIAHWFPKLGVYEPEGWSCHQYHATTEYYSDYGVYDVSLTVPEGFVVGATGREVETTENGDGTVTRRFVQEDVHGFTWTASPDYEVREARFEVPGLPAVDMRLLVQPEHLHQVERHFDATRAALEHYGKWYGPYPYGHVTVVDPAWGSGAGGMEYPTLFTAGSRISRPLGGGSPEGVTIHEAGHQFWYGLVGNNEFEHAWIDEGLNTFSTARAYEAAYGERRYMKEYLEPPGAHLGGFWAVLFPDVRLSRAVTGNRWGRFVAAGAARADDQSEATFRYFPPTSGRLSYDWTALWLNTLERYLGWETVQGILSTFFERYRFRHPRPEDFFAVADEVAGQDLGWFFDQVYRRTLEFDYAVDSVASKAAEPSGFVEDDAGELALVPRPENGEAELYRSEVVVRRLGEGVFPLELLLVFEDGSEVRHSWDGQARWRSFVEERPSKLAYAALDPERVLLLDLDFSNNSRRLEPRADFAARKWASKWMIWLQDVLHTFTFFI